MEAVKRKLFISLEGLVAGVLANQITADDLKTGLFFLGCSRSEVDTAMADLRKQGKLLAEKRPEENGATEDNPYLRARRMIRSALDKANRYGRCRWVIINEKPAYYHLNFLLVDNGYKVLTGYQVCSPATYHEYTAENIINLVATSNPSLQVVF